MRRNLGRTSSTTPATATAPPLPGLPDHGAADRGRTLTMHQAAALLEVRRSPRALRRLGLEPNGELQCGSRTYRTYARADVEKVLAERTAAAAAAEQRRRALADTVQRTVAASGAVPAATGERQTFAVLCEIRNELRQLRQALEY